MDEKITTFKLVRELNSELCCMGTLTLPSGKRLKTLEPCYRGQLTGAGQQKVHGKTAIPFGTYEMTEYLSPRFKRYLPLLQKVPKFEGVEIHVGNYYWNTSGCILVGTHRCISLHDDKTFIEGSVLNSKKALDTLWPEFVEAARQGKVFIEISLAKGVKPYNPI